MPPAPGSQRTDGGRSSPLPVAFRPLPGGSFARPAGAAKVGLIGCTSLRWIQCSAQEVGERHLGAVRDPSVAHSNTRIAAPALRTSARAQLSGLGQRVLRHYLGQRFRTAPPGATAGLSPALAWPVIVAACTASREPSASFPHQTGTQEWTLGRRWLRGAWHLVHSLACAQNLSTRCRWRCATLVQWPFVPTFSLSAPTRGFGDHGYQG